MPSALRVLLPAAIAAALLAAGGAMPASAATVALDGPRLTVTAAPGETNDVRIAAALTGIAVTDTSTPPTAGAGCTAASPGTVTCTPPAAGATVDLGDGDDLLTVTAPLPVTVTDGEGADRIAGGPADDTFIASPGGDRYAGGGGRDLVSYAARTDPVTVKVDATAADGAAGEGDDVRTDVERITGGSGDDRLTGGTSANTLAGGPGDDVLDGSDGNDALDGGGGDDALIGGRGSDVADYSARTAPVSVDLGAGTGGEAGEHDALDGVQDVLGGAGPDVLRGAADGNRLLGGGGDDLLDGREGADTLDGGAGIDTADYSARTTSVWIDLDDRADDGAGERDNVRSTVERVLGGAGNDTITGTGGAQALAGGPGNDALNGSSGDDALDGGSGDDRLDGGDGNDRIGGGSDGNDRLLGGNGTDLLDGGPGNDEAWGGSDSDVIAGSDGDDVLHGDGGTDRLNGGAGADRLGGGDEPDVLDGGPGPDELWGDDGQDTVDYGMRTAPLTVDIDDQPDDGEAGEGDNVHGSVDNVIGGAGPDHLTGSSWQNDLSGEGGDDVIDGQAGRDRLSGGPGADRIAGGADPDELDGGDGNDRLDARDGLGEPVRCGNGSDRADADGDDRPDHCETVRTAPSATPRAPKPTRFTPAPPAQRLKGVRRRVGGGRFVPIPGYDGERIDRRLLADVAYLRRKYHVAITAALAMHGHEPSGEHPIGLAVDLVPGPGGSWNDVDRLARWAEPRQNRPRAPFRWVGYNGDPGHGRGNHLHLSWRHSPTPRGRPAKVVWTLDLRRVRVRPLIVLAARSNHALGRKPSVRTGLRSPARCSGTTGLRPIWRGAARAFGLTWKVLAGLTEVESGHGCNMGPSSAGAIGWTQFMPATWRMWGMDANGDGRASPYDAVDAIYSSARYLRASGAPRSYRRALYAYNHAWWYVKRVLAAARRY